MFGSKLTRNINWRVSFQLICLLLAAVLTFRGSGIELLVMEQFLPDHNPLTHWEKCRSERCHCKLANTCNDHCCCAFREAHPDVVDRDIEESKFTIRHSCQGHQNTAFTWQALPHFIFPSINHHIKNPQIKRVWLQVDKPRFSSRTVEPPEKIPRPLFQSFFC